MRLISLLLASLLMIGCGSGHGTLRIEVLAPSITELAPASVPVNSPPFTITVNGTNFGTDATVFWNGNPHTTFFVSQNQVTTTVTDADLMFFGLAHVFVRTAGLNTNTVDFDVTAQ
jgi:hypothetical protein